MVKLDAAVVRRKVVPERVLEIRPMSAVEIIFLVLPRPSLFPKVFLGGSLLFLERSDFDIFYEFPQFFFQRSRVSDILECYLILRLLLVLGLTDFSSPIKIIRRATLALRTLVSHCAVLGAIKL